MKNSTCSRSSATLSRSREFSAVCQPPVISLRIRSQIWRGLGRRARQAEPAEQQLRDLLLLAQDRATRRFGGMRGEHRLDPDLDHQAADFVEPSPCALSRVTASTMPPGCVVPSFRYWRRRRMRCTFSAMLTISNHSRERAHQVARLRRRHVARAGRELAGAFGAAVAARDRRLPVLLHRLEQGIAALLADHFADQRAEHVHVFPQLGVF